MISEIDAVNEIIEQEQNADVIQTQKDLINLLKRELRYRGECMVDMAKLLAEAGSYDHKGKNEILLRVIGMLLMYANHTTLFTRNMHQDDIPF